MADRLTETDAAADELMDGFIVALQDFDTETLRAIAARREQVNPDGWAHKLIREYLDVWRG